MSTASLREARAALRDVLDSARLDPRVRHAAIEVRSVRRGACVLTGTALDQETLRSAIAQLEGRLPSLRIDARTVQILRCTPQRPATIVTNVADVRARPSFGAEMSCQVLADAEVEILLEPPDGRWTYVRQPDGYLGWVYRPHLRAGRAPARTHRVHSLVALLRDAPSNEGQIVGRLFAGSEITCAPERAEWLRAGARGWIARADLRALADLPADAARRSAEMMGVARSLIGVPYVWGGDTPGGLDCSGFVRLLHRLVGVAIPRDADMQHAVGRSVDEPFAPGDLLYFGDDEAHRTISHVGMSLGGSLLIHCSRPFGGVQIDDVAATPWLRDRFAGARRFI